MSEEGVYYPAESSGNTISADWGGEPKRATEIPRLLDRLDKEAHVIGDSVARLLPTLNMIMHQDTPRAIPDEKPEQAASPLGSRLQEIADKLRETNRVLVNVLGRIEV